MRTSQLVLSAAVAASLASHGLAQHVIHAMNGDQAGANFGRVLAVVDDVDGDGTKDLVVGEPNRDLGSLTDSGAAVLLRTGAWALRARTQGTSTLAHLGGAVAGLGDIDGDTVPDWACGSPNSGLGLGVVRVLSGATGLQIFEVSGEPFSEFGAGICSIGDRNGDGRADFAVGAPVNTPTTQYGVVRFYSGANAALLATLDGTTGTLFGRTLTTIGDLTGDGQPEIAIGEPGADVNGTDAGRVLAKNPRDGLVNSWLWTGVNTSTAGQNAGRAVAVLGDLTGDGKPELLVATNAGVVRIVQGATGSVYGSVSNTEFGSTPSVAGLGDWNGDGVLDFAVGAPTAAFGGGRVFVYSTGSGLPLLATLDGAPSSGFGTAVAGIGDLDGDGRTELAIGSPTYISNGLVVGRVSVHSFDIAPVTAPFGQGCAGSSGVPSLYFAGNANLGESFDILCGNLRQNAFGYLVFGFSDVNAGVFPLPFALQPFGLGQCSLYVSPDAPEAYATTGGTLLTRTMTLPSVPSLATFTFFVQACQFDGGAIGGISFSNAGRIRVGNL